MKLKHVIIYASLLLCGALIGQLTLQADGVNLAGSAEDPLVTKSYLEQRLQGKIPASTPPASPSASGTSLTEEQIKAWIQQEMSKSPSTGTSAAAAPLTVIELKPNQTLFAGAGSEFIVRSGRAVVVSTDGNGVPDVTAGEDLANGALIEHNHLLVFPREGRGIKPDSKNAGDIFVMVRGTYLLVDDQK